MRRAIRTYARDFVAIIVLISIAAGVGGYILANQRLRFPWEPTVFKLKAAFSTAQAVTPGQGQTVRVSGIRIGDISKVDLKDGRAIVTMDVEPKYARMIHTDATALLRPKTGLKDMFVELQPGSPKAPRATPNWTIPVDNTLPDINPDEIYAALDADTRDYLRLLVNGAGQGLKGRSGDLREVFRRFEPTHRDLARVTGAVAERRSSLRRLIHSLNQLNTELAGKGNELAKLVSTSSVVFETFSSQQRNLRAGLGELPSALRQATSTLGRVQTFADVLRPTATNLIPTAKAIDRANGAITPFAREAAPIVDKQVRPFVREARPLIRDLQPASADLAKATPQLTRSFAVLNSLFNLIGFNQNGREPASSASRDEGYLFLIAWVQHNAASLLGSADANGVLRRVFVNGNCNAINATIDQQVKPDLPPAGAAFLSGLSGAVTDPRICGKVG